MHIDCLFCKISLKVNYILYYKILQLYEKSYNLCCHNVVKTHTDCLNNIFNNIPINYIFYDFQINLCKKLILLHFDFQ